MKTVTRFPFSGLLRLIFAALVAASSNSSAQQLPVCAANGSPDANGSGIVYLQYDVPPPANVQATDGLFVSRVDVAWSSVDITAKYFVYRDGVRISPAEGIAATTFSDTAPQLYKTHSYAVTASLDGGISNASIADTGYAIADGSSLGLVATDGTVTDQVRLTWTLITGADGYKIYRNDVLVHTLTGEAVTTYADTSVAGQPTVFAYAVSAYKGTTETSKSVNNGYANVAPASLSGDMETLINQASDPYSPVVIDANGVNDSSTFAITAQGAHGVISVVANKLIYTPNTDYQGTDEFTVHATDMAGASVTGKISVLVGCPVPTIYGLSVSDDLSKLEGMAQVSTCGDPVTTKVQLKIYASGLEVKNYSLALQKVDGDNKYYSFSGDISSLNDGTYSVLANLTDAYSHTASASDNFVVDWNAQANPSFTNKGASVFTGSTSTESFGNIGIK